MPVTQISTNNQEYTGWCPNTPALRTAPAVYRVPEEVIHSDRPDGKGGVPAGLRRGAGIARGSMRILFGNKRLFVFSFLTGLAFLFMFSSEYLIRVGQSYPHPVMSFPVRVALTFGIEVITVFWITVLLAGIVASASGLSGRNAALPETPLLLSLAGLSVILAAAGTVLYIVLNLYSGGLIALLYSAVTQFPFAYILEPGLNGQGPITGLFYQSFAAADTLLLIMINVALFVLTLYVVPSLVIGKKNLRAAVTESAALFRETWGEILSCFLIFCLAFLAVSSLSVLFSAIFGVVSLDGPFWYEFYYKGGWVAAGALYIVVWYILAVTLSTIIGIATFLLYDYGTTITHNLPEFAP